jgi:hypothetical protein
MRAGRFGATTALVAVLALSACADIGLASLDPLAEGTDEAAAEPAPATADGLPPLPEPRPAADAPDDADPDAEPEETASEEDTSGGAPDGPAPDAAAGSGGAPDQIAADTQAAVDAVAAADAPHVYMSLQSDRAGSTSVVFAIDRSRDGTPSDEPAIRITPEETEAKSGRCNPQQLRYYNFPPESADRPVYGPDQASGGVGPGDLPGFMATVVSSEMIASGIADELEDTRPQNVCTRKLFEQTIIAATTGQG